MTRHEAKTAAIQSMQAYRKHDSDHMFGRRQDAPVHADYGHNQGWFSAGEFNFCFDELYEAVTGHPPCTYDGD